MPGLAERLAQVKQEITAECSRLARPEPMLIVVTKNHPVELAEQLAQLGERNFGENRVQEAASKAADFNANSPATEPHWHLIGQLQTNKVKQALEFASSIHSLDRDSLLDELVKRTSTRETPLDVFIQVNLTDDEGRGGVQTGSVLEFADRVSSVSTLKLKGLMAVASLDQEPSADFETIANLSEKLISNHPQASARSIGMSGDYLTALSFGATHLRIGTAITGNRQL